MLTHPRLIPILLALIALVFVIWMRDPALDLRLSAVFFQDGQFIGRRAGIVQSLRNQFWNLSLVTAWTALGAVLAGYLLRWRVLGVAQRDWNIILWGFLLGPGLVVNLILKTFSGRARPVNVTEFGGDKIFTPIGQIADQCAQNCSFVSGEVSGTTATCIALVMILSAYRLPIALRLIAWALIAAMFGFVFWQRIASGGHFTSDAVLAALVTALIMAILARVWPRPADRAPRP